MQRRRLEAEHRLATAKRKGNRIRPKHSRLSVVCGKLARSKVVVLFLNFFGAIACILVNKYVMQKNFELPLTLTLMGYTMVSVILALGKARRGELRCWNRIKSLICGGRRPRDDDTVGDDDSGALSSSRRRQYLLISCTAIAPALANASLNANSVGFTQLSKVLTTPCIAILERWRGIGLPMTWSRLFWLGVVHVGVILASVADVAVSSFGVAIAIVNVLVTAKYKVEWSATSRDRVKVHALGGKPTPVHEVQAVDDVVQGTIPPATLLLVPLAALFEGPRALDAFGEMNSAGFATLGLAAFFGAWTSFTGYAVIGRLSALTHQILGQLKMAVLVVASKLLLGADLNKTQLTGAALTMVAIVAYTHQTLQQRKDLSLNPLPSSSSSSSQQQQSCSSNGFTVVEPNGTGGLVESPIRVRRKSSGSFRLSSEPSDPPPSMMTNGPFLNGKAKSFMV